MVKLAIPIQTSNGLHREVGGGEVKIIGGNKFTFETSFSLKREADQFADAIRKQGYLARVLKWEVPVRVTKGFHPDSPNLGKRGLISWCVYILKNRGR